MTGVTSRPRSTATARTRRLRAAVLVPTVVAGLSLAVAGCGAQAGNGGGAAGHAAEHVMPDGTRMSDAQMQSMTGMSDSPDPSATPDATDAQASGSGSAEQQPAPGRVAYFAAGPSPAAAMICSRETADAVRRNLALPADAPAADAWRPPTYRCDYALPHGTLHLSVRDLRPGARATAWFRGVQDRTHAAHRIKGLQALGLPAFEAPGGEVGFLKDGRTLVVDASGVARTDLPPGFTRTGVAYGVAAAVIACWSE